VTRRTESHQWTCRPARIGLDLRQTDGFIRVQKLLQLLVQACPQRLELGGFRRVAALSLAHVGTAARSALPVLKEGTGDPDKNVSAAFQAAVGQIEKARDEPGWGEGVKKQIAILKDLDEWKKARGK
jgi:hypothetical protein